MKPASVGRGSLAVLWPSLCVIACLVLLTLLSMDTLSAARAFVGGESLWSKAQKRALLQLERYARTGDAADYELFERAGAVPLGDRAARLTLESAEPDPQAVARGFVRGGVDPRDIAGMSRLFGRFARFGEVQRAIDAWRTADDSLLELLSLGPTMREAVHAGDARRIAALLERAYAVDARLTVLEDRFSAALGEASRQAQSILTFVTLLAAAILTLIGILLTRRLLTGQERTAAALRFSERRFQLAITASDHGIWDLDVAANTIHVSSHFMGALGHGAWRPEAPLAEFFALLHPDDRDRVEDLLFARCHVDIAAEAEFRLRSAGGEHRWVRATGNVVRDSNGSPTRMAGAISDITDGTAAKALLFAEKERAQVTLESIGDAVITTDEQGVLDYVNPAAESVIGQSLAAVCGRHFDAVCRFVDEASRADLAHPIERALHAGREARTPASALLVRHDGREVPIDATAAPMLDRDGAVAGIVFVMRDTSHERAAVAELSYQATHDSVTGLLNRREFEGRVTRAVESARREGKRHGVAYLDLDRFKIVNDTCGHAAGDELLRQVGALLRLHLRASDSLARLGGDEFGVLLDNCAPEHALRVIDQLRQAVADFRFASGAQSFAIGASAGLVNLDATFDSVAVVMRAADSACYVAKEAGRDRVQVYQPTDDEFALRDGMTHWATKLQSALDDGRFCLYAQPIVATRDSGDTALHAEVLLRMLAPDGRIVPPMAFLPAAERYNLISAIDQWVVRHAFEALARTLPGTVGTCAINLSGMSLCDERFLDYVLDEYRRAGVEPDTICFEITETAVISNLAQATRFIDELRRAGFRFALDDFGSGMSSFGYLKRLPVDYLKIDGAFVKDMLTDPIDCSMVEAINSIGHVMGIRTIAEFVETEAHVARLAAIGVDYVQGYGVGRPVPLESLLDRHRGRPERAPDCPASPLAEPR